MKHVVEMWYDFETTGLKIEKGAAAVQFACLVVCEGEVVDKLNVLINPMSYPRPVTLDETAMKINGHKEENFPSYMSMENAVTEIKQMAFKWGSKYKQKVTLVGYNNSTFDKYFIEDMFELTKTDFSKFFNWKQVDVFELVKALQLMGVMGETYNQKLGTIAEYFKLDTEGLHDALKDVIATRGIYLKIKEALNG